MKGKSIKFKENNLIFEIYNVNIEKNNTIGINITYYLNFVDDSVIDIKNLIKKIKVDNKIMLNCFLEKQSNFDKNKYIYVFNVANTIKKKTFFDIDITLFVNQFDYNLKKDKDIVFKYFKPFFDDVFNYLNDNPRWSVIGRRKSR